MRFAKHGTCPFCFVQVWKEYDDVFQPVLEFKALPGEHVIPVLKKRIPLYRQAGTWNFMFVYQDPLELARALKAGGAPPLNLHAKHLHQSFQPADKSEPIPIPIDPPF